MRLQNRVARANNLAVRAEIGAQVGELRRSRSVGALGIARERQALEYERAAIRSREHQQMEADWIAKSSAASPRRMLHVDCTCETDGAPCDEGLRSAEEPEYVQRV